MSDDVTPTETGLIESPAPAETPTAVTLPPGHHEHESLAERLEEGRKTFQPGLWLRLIVGGGVIVYLALFVILNTNKVKVSFVFGHTRVSLIWVILLAVALGLVIGVLSSQLHRFRRRHRAATTKTKTKD